MTHETQSFRLGDQSTQMNRRTFVGAASALALSAGAALSAKAQDESPQRPPIIIFTKHLQWLDYDRLSEAVAEMGYDGLDLTVRPGGHVLPENVKTDLPKAVEAARRHNIDVRMITTRISDPGDITTQHILQTASDLGIRYYRIGSYRYDMDQDIMPQLEEWNKRLKALAAMNEKYNMVSGYHIHSGHGYIGGAIWDIHQMMRRIPYEHMGCNYDIGHAVSEGSAGSWEIDFELIKERIHMVAAKDFGWFQEEDGEWDHDVIPLGEGFVPWPRVLRKLKDMEYDGHISLHLEYDVPGDSEEEKHQNLLDASKRDLDFLKEQVNAVWGV